MDSNLVQGYFGHTNETIPENNPIFLPLALGVATESFHFAIPAVTSKSIGIQGVRLRGARDENSSTYTCGLQEEQ